MKIVVNAIASTAGGGKTYLGNLLEWLRRRKDDEFEVWVPDPDGHAPPPSHVHLRTSRLARSGFLGRLLWEQVVLPWRLRKSECQVLLCVGNFCPFWSPVPVVLLSANALYFCRRFVDDLRQRRHYAWIVRHRLKGRMVLASARAADVVVTPTQAMADQVGQSLSRPLRRQRTLWFGYHPRSGSAAAPLLPRNPNEIRFAIVSFYNYFRNFETVFRALAILKRTTDVTVRLVLTTDLKPGLKLGGYDTTSTYNLVRELGITDRVTCLGHVSYDELPRLHASVDGVIAAGYVESFSFTVVEGMAAGLPVLASDIPTHREVAGEAALYFRPFDAEHLASQWLRLANDAQLRQGMSVAGRERSRQFDWDTHFQELLRLSEEAAA